MMNPAEFENIERVERDFWWFRGMNGILLDLLRSEFQRGRPERVLEAGCGTGAFAALLRAELGIEPDVIDLAQEGLEFARRRGVHRAAQADIRALPFADGAFDAVLSLDVIVHLERGNEGAALSELARVLQPNGLAVVRVSALDILRSRHSLYTYERQRFTRGRLIKAARHAGLRAVRSTYLNSFLMPVALAKFRLWEPLFAPEPSSGLEMPPAWLNKALGSVMSCERALVRRGFTFPAGQTALLVARKA